MMIDFRKLCDYLFEDTTVSEEIQKKVTVRAASLFEGRHSREILPCDIMPKIPHSVVEAHGKTVTRNNLFEELEKDLCYEQRESSEGIMTEASIIVLKKEFRERLKSERRD